MDWWDRDHGFGCFGSSVATFCDDFGVIFDAFWCLEAPLERYWYPGSILSENGTRKTPKKPSFWGSVFDTFWSQFLEHVLRCLQERKCDPKTSNLNGFWYPFWSYVDGFRMFFSPFSAPVSADVCRFLAFERFAFSGRCPWGAAVTLCVYNPPTLWVQAYEI